MPMPAAGEDSSHFVRFAGSTFELGVWRSPVSQLLVDFRLVDRRRESDLGSNHGRTRIAKAH